jgi:hypothetical protein
VQLNDPPNEREPHADARLSLLVERRKLREWLEHAV